QLRRSSCASGNIAAWRCAGSSDCTKDAAARAIAARASSWICARTGRGTAASIAAAVAACKSCRRPKVPMAPNATLRSPSSPGMRILLLAVLVLVAPAAAVADDAVWVLLRGGVQVVLMRHTITTPGVGDPAGFRLDDCATQRTLPDPGREAGGRRVPRARASRRPRALEPVVPLPRDLTARLRRRRGLGTAQQPLRQPRARGRAAARAARDRRPGAPRRGARGCPARLGLSAAPRNPAGSRRADRAHARRRGRLPDRRAPGALT